MKTLFENYFELAFWMCAITLLAFTPSGSDAHYSLCLFKVMGINFCPGCGLGHSINNLLHGNIRDSFSSHPFGPFALVIIINRIYKLVRLNLYNKKINKEYATR